MGCHMTGLVVPDAASADMSVLVDLPLSVEVWLESDPDAAAVVEQWAKLGAVRDYVAKVGAPQVPVAHAERLLEVRIGELLGEPEPGGWSSRMSSPSDDMLSGLHNKLRQEFRLMAAHPDLTAEAIARKLDHDRPPTRNHVITHIRAVLNDMSRRQAAEHDPGTDFDFRHGDFRAALADIEPGTVDLILTDPPYGPKHTDLYDALGEFAARTLKPGGSLIAYSGQSNLGEAWAALNAHLRYWWTLALEHRAGGQQLMGKRVICEWKPLLWFVRDRRGHDRWVADRVRGSGARKDLHEWAQGVEEVAYLVEQLTDPGDLVVDPFAGSGSFGYAAVELGRRFVGCDDGSHPDGGVA